MGCQCVLIYCTWNHSCQPDITVTTVRLGSDSSSPPVPLLMTNKAIKKNGFLSISYWQVACSFWISCQQWKSSCLTRHRLYKVTSFYTVVSNMYKSATEYFDWYGDLYCFLKWLMMNLFEFIHD